MEIRPSLLSYIFAGSTKWRINYEFPELTLELDGTLVKQTYYQVMKIYFVMDECVLSKSTSLINKQLHSLYY